jgi:ABC-2 type transport system permease protein
MSMLKGLWSLTWLEIKIFVREPLGLVGTVGVPVAVVLVLGRIAGPATRMPTTSSGMRDAATLPVLVALLIALNAVLSLVTIIAIYREGGILKRLRATPLRSHTILTAHVLAKLLFTAVTLALTVFAGTTTHPLALDARLFGFMGALSITTVSLLSIGFLIASVVPTARFAQPIGSLILYPMLALSGLFMPVAALPPVMRAVSHVVPLTYAVSFLRGVWLREPWSAHLGDVAALALVFAVCTTLSSRVFRWE